MPKRNWFTVDEAAAQLGVSPHTLRMQLRVGKLAGEKAGRDWLISTPEITRYRTASLGRNQGTAQTPTVAVAQPAVARAAAGSRFGAPSPAPKPGRKSERTG